MAETKSDKGEKATNEKVAVQAAADSDATEVGVKMVEKTASSGQKVREPKSATEVQRRGSDQLVAVSPPVKVQPVCSVHGVPVDKDGRCPELHAGPAGKG